MRVTWLLSESHDFFPKVELSVWPLSPHYFYYKMGAPTCSRQVAALSNVGAAIYFIFITITTRNYEFSFGKKIKQHRCIFRSTLKILLLNSRTEFIWNPSGSFVSGAGRWRWVQGVPLRPLFSFTFCQTHIKPCLFFCLVFTHHSKPRLPLSRCTSCKRTTTTKTLGHTHRAGGGGG